MTGFPQERPARPGDGGPVSGSSPPSVSAGSPGSPESLQHADEHGEASPAVRRLVPSAALRTGAQSAQEVGVPTGAQPHLGDQEAAAPHWREFADAVWLAAYWARHDAPTSLSEASGPAPGGVSVSPRTSEDARSPDAPPTDPAALSAPPPVERLRPGRPLTVADRPAAASPVDPARLVGPGGLAGTPYEPAAPVALLSEYAVPFELHQARPLLPADEGPQRLPGRGTALLARALHRLARRTPSRHTLELDEETTAEQGLADGMWLPFLRPAHTAAFDLLLLVDDAPTMRVWGDTAASLVEAAEHSGAFRSVRRVRIDVPRTGAARLREGSGKGGADPAELLDGRGGRVHLVVTDGLAHGWAASTADDLLRRLAHAGPTALVHLLPPHLRRRSSLYPHRAVLEAGGFGAANDALQHWAPPGGPDPLRPLPNKDDGSVLVPVLSIKPGSITAWADLVTGQRGVRRELPIVLAGTLSKGAPAPGLRAPRSVQAAPVAVRRFFTLATPVARRLATQLAAVPFEFDLVDQLRRRIMPETGPDHVAEILMGGLIDWGVDGASGPEFAEGVREALLAETTRSQLARTVSVVGELPAAGERGLRLRAALRDPGGTSLPDPAEDGWVRSELAVMRALSGPYAERARRIEPNRLPRPFDTAGPVGNDRPPDTSTEVNPPPDGDSFGGQGIAATSHGPDESGESVQSSETDTNPDITSEAEPLMHGTTTTTSALLVNVPLRNTSFVGRQALLRAVGEQLGSQDTAAVLPHALHGLGGVGKSQLALEYVYTHQHEFRVICWIPAERETLILAALATLAAQLGVAPSRHDNNTGTPTTNTAVPAVMDALRTGAPYDNWLLVFDNAEDIEAVRKYFPTNGPGKVIVTSRNRAWERVATPLPVDVFEREESIELLQKRSPDLTAPDADRLAEALGDLPLAVEQAGAWRAVTGMLVDEYLDLLAQRSPEILALEPNPDYPVSVAAAWDISLERLGENNPGARQLLDICASMAPEPIPRSMLRGSRGVSITPEVDPLLLDAIKLNRAIRDLSQFSLVKVDPRSDTLQMHRLLQTVLLAKLSLDERESMRHAAHQLLSAAKPGPSASSLEWRAYQALLPHVLTSQAVICSDTYVRELVFDTVWFLFYWGDHEGAAGLARDAWSSWLASSGEQDSNVNRMAKALAFMLRQTGQITESIPLTEKALEVSRATEAEPEELIDSLCEMSDARGYQGLFREAKELTREATDLSRSLFGSDDPMTLRSTHSLGRALRLCGEFQEGLALDQENARMRELLFGSDNFLALNSCNGLSIDMRESGDYRGARDFQEDLHRRARAVMGEDHPLTLRIARDLAVCRRRDGALDEARSLAESTLRRFTARYGPDHYDSLATATELSVLQRMAGDLEASRRLAEDTAQRFGELLGQGHACTLLTRANLAATLRALGDLDAAREHEDEAARRLTETVGARHPITLTVAVGQANTAYALLDFKHAKQIDEANLLLLTEVAGENHPMALSVIANLALDLRGLGSGREADAAERKAVDGFTRVLRLDHPWLLAARQRHRIECDSAAMPL